MNIFGIANKIVMYVIVLLITICVGCYSAEASWHNSDQYHISMFFPDTMTMLPPRQNRTDGVVIFNGADVSSRMIAVVCCNIFDKDEVKGEALIVAKDYMREFVRQRGYYVINEGYFDVKPNHKGVYLHIKDGRSSSNTEFIYAWLWIHGRFYSIEYTMEKGHASVPLAMQSLNSVICNENH